MNARTQMREVFEILVAIIFAVVIAPFFALAFYLRAIIELGRFLWTKLSS